MRMMRCQEKKCGKFENCVIQGKDKEKPTED